MIIETLAWDSEFFGLSIGKASAEAPLIEVAKLARQQDLTCVYIETEAALTAPPKGTDLVLADKRVRLRVERPTVHAKPATTSVRDGTIKDLPLLALAIDAVAPWSRFAQDRRFGLEAARKMYEAWLMRAALSNDECFGVVDSDGSPFAFVTATMESPPEIGLIAAAAPNSGAGTSLIRWAKAATAEYGPLEVVTQATNERALSLYTREGFEECGRTNVYHLWINSKGTAS